MVQKFGEVFSQGLNFILFYGIKTHSLIRANDIVGNGPSGSFRQVMRDYRSYPDVMYDSYLDLSNARERVYDGDCISSF